MAPSHPQYQALREVLGRYRAHLTRGWPAIEPRGVVEPGDPLPVEAFDALTARLRAEGWTSSSSLSKDVDPDGFVGPPPLYDEALADGVRRFKRSRGLPDDGVLGPSTVDALAVPIDDDVARIERSLDRWRWMPRDLGGTHLLVQIPAYRLQLVRDGAVVDDMAVVTGKPDTPTPVFADQVETVVLNPYWNVPSSIARDQHAVKARTDPGWLAANGYEVVDARGRRIDPQAASGRYGTGWRIRQRPGRGNALGTLKILFPNDHAVYLHDTPQRHLFARSSRAYSHGCVRVEHPHRLAAALLGDRSEQDVTAAVATGRQEWLPVEAEIPIYLVYMNAEADEDGAVRFLPDVYGLDRAHADALEDAEPRYAEGAASRSAG